MIYIVYIEIVWIYTVDSGAIANFIYIMNFTFFPSVIEGNFDHK
jgi:hypothetical protein